MAQCLPASQALKGKAAVIPASDGFELALGLGKHLDSFAAGLRAEGRNVRTVLDLDPQLSNVKAIGFAELGRRLLRIMDKAEHIHVNLKGTGGKAAAAEAGADGIGPNNITNWEIFQVERRHPSKSTFHNEGTY